MDKRPEGLKKDKLTFYLVLGPPVLGWSKLIPLGWMKGRNWEGGSQVWGGEAAGEDWEKEN